MQTILVQIIGAPIACKEGVKDSWRDVAKWAAGQLKGHFGEAVDIHYFDLFDADCPPMSNGAQLPLVMVDGEVVSSGGKISMPDIRRKIKSIMEKQTV
jgi:disulfide oxidoreductase YuzD